MPYYLRLLNNPVIRQGRSNHAHGSKKRNTTKATSQQPVIEHVDVQFKLSCTTDLGDAYYDGDLSIDVHLLSSERSSESVASSSVTWRKGMRVLAETVQLRCIEELGFTEYWLYLEAQYDEKLLVGASQVAKGSNLTSSRLLTCSLPEIVSVLAPVSFPSCSASDEDINQHVLRRFNIPKIYSSEWNDRNLHSKVEYLELYVFEEMGESIARHVWDAGLALLALCTDGILKNVPQESIGTRSLLRSFFDPSKRSGQQLEILELGSGCGIVGVGLARTISNARIILTDLPEAMDILQKNISKSINVGLASGTTIRGQTLDWNTVLTNTQNMKFDETQDLASLKPDLVLVSDCTYNPSSFEALIATLVQLVKQAHQRHHHDGHMKLDVLVSYKTRHESESRFFEDMDRAGFEMLAEDEVLFPNRTRETLGLDLEKGEIFAFGLRE